MSFQDNHSEAQKEVDRRVRQRVLDGIQLLQEQYGESWVDHINLDRFDLKCGTSCVLGQVYGDWNTGCDKLHINDRDGEFGFSERGVLALIHDVYGDEDSHHSLYRDFEIVWRQQISRLKSLRQEEVPV